MILKSVTDVITCQLCYLFSQDKDNVSFMCRLHVPSTSPFLSVAHLILLSDTLMCNSGVQPILPIKVSITIDTVLNVSFEINRDGDDTCKQTFCSKKIVSPLGLVGGGALISLFWTSGDICPGFQSQGRSPHLCALSSVYNGFLRFTSGVTPADLSAASMVAEPFRSTYFRASIGGARVHN